MPSNPSGLPNTTAQSNAAKIASTSAREASNGGCLLPRYPRSVERTWSVPRRRSRCAQMPRPGYSLTAPHPEPCKAMTIRWNTMKRAIQNCLIASAVSSGYFKPAILIQGRRRRENFHFDICCNSSICPHCPSFCWRHREKKRPRSNARRRNAIGMLRARRAEENIEVPIAPA